MDLTNMNKGQLEAVKHNEGPLLVLAGAGSGKTRVLTTRVAYLVLECGIDPNGIVAITFTNKAAKEMKGRIYNLTGALAKNIWISTFHSFGLKIIKDNYEKLGFEKNFTILDSDDSLTIIKKIIKNMGIDSKKYYPRAIKNAISGAKNEMISPEKYNKFVNNDYDQVVLDVYNIYEKKLKSNNGVDFDDLLLLPIRLFEEYPEVLKQYQEQYKYILVDEYQDTNTVQYTFTKMLSEKHKNICVVGDADQSIYGFRHANYKNILNFEKDYKEAKTILLEQNYRSTETILKAANNVIKNNVERKEKNLWSENGEGDKIKYRRSYDEKDEAHYVGGEIEKLKKQGVSLDEIAVLYRTNAQSRMMEEELFVRGIPYKVVGSFFFYSRKEIKDMISYLKLIYNSKDDISLTRCINTPKRGIGLKSVEKLNYKASLENVSLYEAIDEGKELDFKNIIEEIKAQVEHISLTELIDLILDKTGMRQALLNQKTMESEIRVENLDEFKSITKNYEERYGEISLAEFLDELALVSDIRESKENETNVNLMTVHSVKGLEFDYIFIIGLEEGIFPHINSLMSMADIEEERRLCYVALTRARKRVFIINTKRRRLFGREQINQPSRFIKEIGKALIEVDGVINKREIKIDKDELFNKGDITFSVGEHINHDVYGEGVVVSVDKEIISVAFSHKHGVKRLMKNHKSIKKI